MTREEVTRRNWTVGGGQLIDGVIALLNSCRLISVRGETLTISVLASSIRMDNNSSFFVFKSIAVQLQLSMALWTDAFYETRRRVNW